MVPSTDLFELIKTLTGSEKRYLKLYAVSIGGKKNSAYLRLFDAINRMQVYDENLLKQQLKNEAFVRQLSVAKNYLYSIILKCLVQFYERSSVSPGTAGCVKSVEVLFDKGLFKQCYRQIKKAQIQSLQQERFFLYEQLLEWEAKVYAKEADYGRIVEVTAQQIKMLQRREADLQCKKLAYDIYEVTVGGSKTSAAVVKLRVQQVQQLLAKAQLPKEAGTLGRYYFYSAHTLYYGYVADTTRRLQFAQKVIEELEASPSFVEANPSFYSFAANNLCNALMAAGKHGETKKWLQKIRQFIRHPRSPLKNEMAASTILLTYHIELLLFINTGLIAEAAALEKQVKQVLQQYKSYLSRDSEWDVLFSMAHALFLAGDFKGAAEWLSGLLQTGRFSARYDLYVVSKLFYLLILVEQGDWKLLQNLCTTILQYLRRKGLDSGIESELIRILKVYRTMPASEKIPALQKLYKMIESAKHKRKPSLLVELLDVESWLLSKIKEKPIVEIASARVVK